MNDEYENAKKTSSDGSMMNVPGFQMKWQTENQENSTAKRGAQENLKGVENWTASKSEAAVTKEEILTEWKMPEPVFRVSSGKTPDKSARETAQNALPFAKPINLEKTSAATVQSQPNISAEFTVNKITERPFAEREESSSKIVFVVLGLVVVVVFAAAFLTAIYFLFFNKLEM